MSVVIRLSELRNANGRIAFNRQELNRLLSLYSRRVMAGEWRDYAIDMRRDGAVFSIYRHTAEGPLYAIWKVRPGKGGPFEYELYQGVRRLSRSRALDETLRTLERRLRVVA
ncbi:MAG: DUF2794 domain-containing protein [Alphaproteobacteria bacterium]